MQLVGFWSLGIVGYDALGAVGCRALNAVSWGTLRVLLVAVLRVLMAAVLKSAVGLTCEPEWPPLLLDPPLSRDPLSAGLLDPCLFLGCSHPLSGLGEGQHTECSAK